MEETTSALALSIAYKSNSTTLALLAALLDNNVQSVGPYSSSGGVSTPGTTVWFDSPAYTLLQSPTPGNATVDIKASLSVSDGTAEVVTFTLVRDRGTATAQVLATQQVSVSAGTNTVTCTLACLDTTLTVPALTYPLTERSTHTYSIEATGAAGTHNLTGVEPASIVLEQLPSGTAVTVSGAGTGAVAMGSLVNFASFAGAGISTTPGVIQLVTVIDGNIGLGPGVTSTAFTGFAPSLTAGASFATSSLVHASATQNQYGGPGADYQPPTGLQPGYLYARDYAAPTPTNVNLSYNDLLAAYTDASSRPASAANTNIGGGVLTGATAAFTPGVYKWNSNVTVTGSITFNGAGVYIFIVTGTFDLESAAQMILSGGATAGSVYLAIAGATTLHSSSIAVGEFLAATNIAMQDSAQLTGRALAQTGVTLIGNTIIEA